MSKLHSFLTLQNRQPPGEERFVKKYVSTIGVDFGVKPVSVSGTPVKVNFWDLSGQPEFFEVRNEFYKDTQGAILVYDCTSRASFKAVRSLRGGGHLQCHASFTKNSAL